MQNSRRKACRVFANLHPPLVVATIATIRAKAATKGSCENTSGASGQETSCARQVDQSQGYPEASVTHGSDFAPSGLWRDASASCKNREQEKFYFIQKAQREINKK